MFSRLTVTDRFRHLCVSLFSAALVFASTSSHAAITTIGGFATIQADFTDDDFFGHAVAVSGNGLVLAVGAPYEDSNFVGFHAGDITWDNSVPNSGAVYVYTRSSLTAPWNLTGYVKAPDTQTSRENALFGSAVSLSADGSILAIGAPGENNGIGAYYVYYFNGFASNGKTLYWTSANCKKDDGGGLEPSCGSAVALSGDGKNLLVGAPRARSEAGAAYLQTWHGSFPRTFNGDRILPAGTYNGAHLGASVAINYDGSAVVIGAPDASYSAPGDGMVVVVNDANAFEYSDVKKQAFASPNPITSGQFGFSVALPSGKNRFAVGAPGENNSQGAVYAYNSTTPDLLSKLSSLKPWKKITAANGEAGDSFGYSVSFTANGYALVIGAPFEDSLATGVNGDQFNNLSPNAGAAYIFWYSDLSKAWSAHGYLKASDTFHDDHYGGSVAVAGDGLTIAIGAPIKGGNVGQLAAGAAYVY